tara:strand:+ start:746 stop:970 length:225 start_codon:yes stop_codon:yes gene_type:complete
MPEAWRGEGEAWMCGFVLLFPWCCGDLMGCWLIVMGHLGDMDAWMLWFFWMLLDACCLLLLIPVFLSLAPWFFI